MKLNPFVVIAGFSILFLPFCLNTLGARSLSIGTLLGASVAFLFAILNGSRMRSPSSFLYFFIPTIAINILCTSIYYQQAPSLEQCAGVFSGLLLIFFAGILAYQLDSIPIRRLNVFVNPVVYLIITLSFISLALKINTFTYSNSILYFSEPSHLAIALSPFSVYSILSTKIRSSLCLAFSLLILAIWLQNTTLLALSIACSLILSLRFRLSIFFRSLLALSLSLCFLLLILNSQYLVSRISLDPQNISSLVYLRGLQSSAASLARPPFVGVGLQMMASRAPSTPAVDLLNDYNLGDLNNSDGGFVAAKFLTEFGWLGLSLLIYSLARALRLFVFALKLSSQGMAAKSDIIFISCIVSVLIQLFVRGAGYLGPFLVLAVLAYHFRPVLTRS